MNIVIIGAHPDDPEAGCGGLAIKAAKDGHRVIMLYLSSGIPGRLTGERLEAEVREEEARAACEVCGAEPHFFRYPTSNIPFDQEAVTRLCDYLREVDADLVLGHWVVDTHPDHQASGALATQAVVGNPGVALAFYESCPGIQTLAFEPNRYVDISDVAEQKKKAVECHVSQNVNAWWFSHEQTERFHLLQAKGYTERAEGCAEGYHLLVSTPEAEALFVTRGWLQSSGSRTVRRIKHEKAPLYT